jgi:hypothetical protein
MPESALVFYYFLSIGRVPFDIHCEAAQEKQLQLPVGAFLKATPR